MNTELEKLFSPDVLAALDERIARIAREAGSPEQRQRPDNELTVREVAGMKRVKPRTVYEWVRRYKEGEEGGLRHHFSPTGRLRFYRADVEAHSSLPGESGIDCPPPR